MTTAGSIDSLVVDFFITATEAILVDRKAHLQPITSSSHKYYDFTVYIRQALQAFRKDTTKPLIIDLYMFHPTKNTHHLIEKWCLSYQIQSDGKDNRPLAIITRRVHTLLRSLYCFVRLLPGFNMLHISSKRPLISFQIHTQKDVVANFHHEPSKYTFAPISTSKGLLSTTVSFLRSAAVEDILKALNGSNMRVMSDSPQQAVSSK
jgi:hypothetical protein